MTVGGLLHIDEVDHADIIHLGSVVIPLEGERAHIVSWIPKKSAAEFIIYWVWDGCNHCGKKYFLLDAAAKSPRPLYITSDDYDDYVPEIVSYRPGVISFRRAAAEDTSLGDTITEVIEYRRGDKDFTILRHTAVDDYKKFIGKGIEKFVADLEARYTLVELMGAKEFSEFRKYIYESDEKFSLIEGRYLWCERAGHGHRDEWRHTILIIDTFLDRAWVAQSDGNQSYNKPSLIKGWGSLKHDDSVVRNLFDEWLKQFGKKLAAQNGLIKIVDVPQPSTTSPPLPANK